MNRVHFHLVAALTLAALAGPSGRADEPHPSARANNTASKATRVAPASDTVSCTIYALNDLGDDAELGQWIANTIPDVIQPTTWTRNCLSAGFDGRTCQEPTTKRIVSYYPPSKLLVVYHTPAVQAEVAAFIANVKKALPADRARATARNTKPVRTEEPTVAPVTYLVPPPAPPRYDDGESVTQPPTLPAPPSNKPKHLFHFIIRYEGEGVIDSNVVELFKNYATEATRSNNGGGVPAFSTPPTNAVPPTCMLPLDFGNFVPYGVCQPVPGGPQTGPYVGPGGVPVMPHANPIVPTQGVSQPTAAPSPRPLPSPTTSGAKPAASPTVASSPVTSGASHRPPAASAPVNSQGAPGIVAESEPTKLTR